VTLFAVLILFLRVLARFGDRIVVDQTGGLSNYLSAEIKQ
jgi:hypothetical protein